MSAQIGGSKLSMLYGTAWKADRTAKLVYQALQTGFRGVDTAAQPRHYQEHLVGQGIREAISAGIVKREELYIQTKYTPISGQDPRNLPYDPKKSITDQVNASVASSLRNLRTSPLDNDSSNAYLDCLVLHSPLPDISLTLEAWRAMSAFVPSPIRSLGISNVSLPVLEALYENSSVKPTVVQNRFYATTAYDGPVRAFCAKHGITYQSFWTLTGNPALLRSQLVAEMARIVGVEPEVALYALVRSLGNITILNGTTSHMKSDLDGLQRVERWRADGQNESTWLKFATAFEWLINAGA